MQSLWGCDPQVEKHCSPGFSTWSFLYHHAADLMHDGQGLQKNSEMVPYQEKMSYEDAELRFDARISGAHKHMWTGASFEKDGCYCRRITADALRAIRLSDCSDIFVCLFSTKQGWGDGSVSEMLALQAKGSELGCSAPVKAKRGNAHLYPQHRGREADRRSLGLAGQLV